jgi:hypothetical protein
MTGPAALPTWSQLAVRPQITDPMRRYLDQIAGSSDLSMGSGSGVAVRR